MRGLSRAAKLVTSAAASAILIFSTLAAGTATAAEHLRAHDSAGQAPVGSAPYQRACGLPAKPGYATCDALVRTDATARQGKLAANAIPLGYGPADLQSAYALPSKTAGQGATVALIDAYNDPTAAADLAVYRKQYGLPPCTAASGCFRKINEQGGATYPPGDEGWSEEISLDLDMVSAACPNCHILLVEANSPDITDLGAAEDEAVALGARYISNSYGTIGIDPEATQWDAQYYTHPGVVITASAGDEGYGDGFPAGSPHVVAVGGTSLTRDPSAARGWTESVWKGTGSGCTTFPKPSWQHDSGCTGRTENDVAAVADPNTGVAVYDSYGRQGWAVFGGTSASSPLIASVYALAGQPVGGTNPASYLYAHPSALNDVTTGSNSSVGCTPAYLCTAGPGYDGPTGLGTPEGTAAFTGGPHGTVTGTVRTASGTPVAGAQVQIGGASGETGSSGRYTITAPDGSYTPQATLYGYHTATGSTVTVTSGGTLTRNFTLTRLAQATVSGTVTDASGHGWGLYAQITVPGTPVVGYTNPLTGKYSLRLPVGSYTLQVSAQTPGYEPGTTTVHVTGTAASANVGLQVDPLACSAPGYHPIYRGYSQNFDSGKIPSGWTVQDVQAPPTSWQFNNPNHLPNLTGGSGGFAVEEGITYPQDTSTGGILYTPVINMSKDKAPVLQFNQDLVLNGGTAINFVQIQMSVDGGQWQPIYLDYANEPGPVTQLIPIPRATGQPEVQFQLEGNMTDSSWEIDNFFAGDKGCGPAAGGLVEGQVRDANTDAPVNGATVSGAGHQVTTAPAPGDPAVGGGLYALFQPAGTTKLTVSNPGYTTRTQAVSVTAGKVTPQNLTLDAGRLSVTPGPVKLTAPLGGTGTARVKITNTGTAPVNMRLSAQDGTVTVMGEGAPLRRIPGHYTPALNGSPAKHAPAATATLPGTWASTASYPEYVSDNAAATDPVTGDVYSVGGVVDGSSTANAFVYSPAIHAWKQLPDMSFAREDPVAAFMDGKLYVTEGIDGDNADQTHRQLEIYDPHTGHWSPGAPAPYGYYGSAVGSLDGKMYVVGGCWYNARFVAYCDSTHVQVYDSLTNTWTLVAKYPVGAGFLGCGAIAGKLYCAGGYVHALQTGTSAVYAYNPATNAWSAAASMPSDEWGGAVAAADGQLLVSGGIARFDQELTNQGFAYNPATNTWSPLPNAPDAVYRGGSACGFYVIGGEDPNGTVAATSVLPGYNECDGDSGVPWLSLSQQRATLAPGQSVTVTLTARADLAQPGQYSATLSVDSGTPYPHPQVPVDLTAAAPKNWGAVAGTVDGTACDGTKAPVDDATVQAGNWTLTTGADGTYAAWFPVKDSPVTVIASADNWLAVSAAAKLTAGHTTTVNFNLHRSSCD
jgi:N-acetylneuraminic acid mutarotase